jgi:hypothetical protein
MKSDTFSVIVKEKGESWLWKRYYIISFSCSVLQYFALAPISCMDIINLIKKAFKEYPNLQHDLENRHIVYNETLDKIDKLEREGQIFVIRPSKPIACAMIEKDPNHLQEIYDIGRRDALNSLEELKKYLWSVSQNGLWFTNKNILGVIHMNFFKKPGRILLLIMIVLAVVCPYRVHMYKTKIEEIKSGKLKINDMQYAADDLHPYSAYLMAVPYIIIEVSLGSLYYVRTRD